MKPKRKNEFFVRATLWTIKWSRTIIIVWLAVLIVLFPLGLKLGEIIVYDERPLMPQNTESARAETLLKKSFPELQINSSALIVLQAKNVTSDEIKNYTISLGHSILRDETLKPHIRRFYSIYYAYELMLTLNALTSCGVSHAIQNHTNHILWQLYAGPEFYLSLWGNRTVSYEQFLRDWASFSENISVREKEFLFRYHRKYCELWNLSFIPGTQYYLNFSVDVKTRAERIVTLAAPAVFNYSDNLLVTVAENFNLSTWNNISAQRQFAIMYTAKRLNLTPEFVAAAHQLVPSAFGTQDRKTISEFVGEILSSKNIHSYPVKIPVRVIEDTISRDKTVMLIYIGFDQEPHALSTKTGVKRLRELAAELRAQMRPVGLQTYVTGGAALTLDLETEFSVSMGRVEPVTIFFVLLLSIMFFGAFSAPLISLVLIGSVLIAVQGLTFLLARYFMPIHYLVIILMFTVTFAAGTDYCIFILSRYREELNKRPGASSHTNLVAAMRWAGKSVATSGLAVVIAFGALGLSSFALMRYLGLLLALALSITLLAILTFLPALLAQFGKKVFWPSLNRGAKIKTGYFLNAAKFSVRHAKLIIILALLVSVPITYFVLRLETSHDVLETMPCTEAMAGIRTLSAGFGAGAFSPSYLVVQAANPIYDNRTGTFDSEKLSAIDQLQHDIARIVGIRRIVSSAVIETTRIDRLTNENLTAERLAQALGKTNDTVVLLLYLNDTPFSSTSLTIVRELREKIACFQQEQLRDAKIYLGGATASMVDISCVVENDFKYSALVVIIGIYILLLVMLSSVLIPFRLLVTVLLSISWTLALAFIVFSTLYHPLQWLLPMVLFIMLLGLGMDYDIFLTMRIREEVLRGKSDEQAAVTAVVKTGAIITVCGAIMAAAFGSIMLSSIGMLQQYGFGLCVAIILDALLVRIYLVPAIMVIMKKWNWWTPLRKVY